MSIWIIYVTSWIFFILFFSISDFRILLSKQFLFNIAMLDSMVYTLFSIGVWYLVILLVHLCLCFMRLFDSLNYLNGNPCMNTFVYTFRIIPFVKNLNERRKKTNEKNTDLEWNCCSFLINNWHAILQLPAMLKFIELLKTWTIS